MSMIAIKSLQNVCSVLIKIFKGIKSSNKIIMREAQEDMMQTYTMHYGRNHDTEEDTGENGT